MKAEKELITNGKNMPGRVKSMVKRLPTRKRSVCFQKQEKRSTRAIEMRLEEEAGPSHVYFKSEESQSCDISLKTKKRVLSLRYKSKILEEIKENGYILLKIWKMK